MPTENPPTPEEELTFEIGNRVSLSGSLNVPEGAHSVVIFAHGSGSSRFSPRNNYVARILNEGNIGTFLFDLLSPTEEIEDARTAHLRFDINLLADRLVSATDWLLQHPAVSRSTIGYFGASTGAAAALLAAAERADIIGAVVSRGGRPDLAGPALAKVRAPTLLIVGGLDHPVIDLNRQAFHELRVEKRMDIVPGATHLFEEPGTLQEVSRLARGWFDEHLRARREDHIRVA